MPHPRFLSLHHLQSQPVRLFFLELPEHWLGEWHPPLFRQWMIRVSGEIEIETGDGKKIILNAGDVFLLDETTGKGHQTTALGNARLRIAALHCS